MEEGKEHVCQCRECHPETFPTGERQGPMHYGVRFGDARLPIRFLLNGQPTEQVYEACAGRDGWIWQYRGKTEGDRTIGVHRCPCGRGACEEIVHGEVTVVSREETL